MHLGIWNVTLYLEESTTNTVFPPTEIWDAILYHFYSRNDKEICGSSLNSFWYFVGKEDVFKMIFYNLIRALEENCFRSLAVYLEQHKYRVSDLKMGKYIKEERIWWLGSYWFILWHWHTSGRCLGVTWGTCTKAQGALGLWITRMGKWGRKVE